MEKGFGKLSKKLKEKSNKKSGKNYNVVCIIPARGNSKGIPDKNRILIAGKPLILWTIEQARKSSYIDDKVYVSSDDIPTLTLAKSFNAQTIVRPDDISTDTSTSESALLHALSELEKSEREGVIDIIVFLQATSPLRDTNDIDDAIDFFIENNLDSLFSACDLKDLMVWRHNENNLLSSINYDYKNRKRRQDIQSQYGENGSIYIFKPNILKEYNNRLGGKIGMYIMDSWKLHEIDTKQDIEICEFYIKNKNLG